MKLSRAIGSLAGVAGIVLLLYLGHKNRHLFLFHDVTSGESPEYPTLRSRVYYAAPKDILEAAQHALETLPGWELVKRDTTNLALDAKAPAPWALPSDKVTVYVLSCGGGQSRVIIRSHSERGLGDFGRNAAHIRALQAAMDRRLTGEAAI